MEALPAEEVADLYRAAVAGDAVVGHQRVLVHVRREDRQRDQVGRVGAGDHPTWCGPDLAPRWRASGRRRDAELYPLGPVSVSTLGQAHPHRRYRRGETRRDRAGGPDLHGLGIAPAASTADRRAPAGSCPATGSPGPGGGGARTAAVIIAAATARWLAVLFAIPAVLLLIWQLPPRRRISYRLQQDPRANQDLL